MRHLRPRGAGASQLVPRTRRELDVQVQARRRDSAYQLLRLCHGTTGGFHPGEFSSPFDGYPCFQSDSARGVCYDLFIPS